MAPHPFPIPSTLGSRLETGAAFLRRGRAMRSRRKADNEVQIVFGVE